MSRPAGGRKERDALRNLHNSLHPVKVELNELDWKSGLSEKSERLAQHISAFANQMGGGTFAFGVNNDTTIFTPTREQAESIVDRLGNIARNNLHFPIKLEHASVEYEGLADYGFCKKQENGWAITNLGAALFARDLRKFHSLEFRYVVVRQYKGANNLDISAETFFYEGYAISLDKIVKYVMSLLEKTEDILHPQRENRYPYPEVAIRELSANMVLHQSFDVHGMTLALEIFTNRIVMTNPGAPLIDSNRFIDLPPKSRNDKMAQAMFLFNLCEKRGSGMDRAVAGIEAMHLPAITIERGEDFTRTRLFPLKKYTEMTRVEKVQACYQHACLLYEKGFELTNQSLRERLGMPKNNSAGASRIIADAVEGGLIRLSDKAPDSKKYSSYVPYYV